MYGISSYSVRLLCRYLCVCVCLCVCVWFVCVNHRCIVYNYKSMALIYIRTITGNLIEIFLQTYIYIYKYNDYDNTVY